jgi:hypothetical protein
MPHFGLFDAMSAIEVRDNTSVKPYYQTRFADYGPANGQRPRPARRNAPRSPFYRSKCAATRRGNLLGPRPHNVSRGKPITDTARLGLTRRRGDGLAQRLRALPDAVHIALHAPNRTCIAV